MKKTLDENSFFVTKNTLGDMTENEFLDYLETNGKVCCTVGYWGWIRNLPINDPGYDEENKENYLTYSDLINRQLEWIRKGYVNGPGTSKSFPASIETYNRFAKWDVWHGGYVENHGYIGVPSSSEYGCPLFLGSWYSRGSSANPFRVESFYKLQAANNWPGGEVENWGYVDSYKKVLGSSLSFDTVPASERQLGNIYNLSAEIGYSTIELRRLREQFKSSYSESLRAYDIDNVTLRNFLNSQFYASSNTNLKKALLARDGIILRIVTREGSINGQKVNYGDDFLIVDYNGLLRTYIYVNPVDLSVGSISADIFSDSSIKIEKFIYYHKRRD